MNSNTTRRRASPGYTYEPCHGCGKDEYRRKATLCRACTETIEKAEQRQRELAAMGDDAPAPHLMKERAYALPSLWHCEREPVEQAFFDLGQLLSEPTTGHPPYEKPDQDHQYPWVDESKWNVWPFPQNSYRSSDWVCVRAIRPSHAQAIRTLFAAVRQALDEAHTQGFKEGKNLLAQLASGQITMDKFNEISIREEGRGS